jgi:hypothetical protein
MLFSQHQQHIYTPSLSSEACGPEHSQTSGHLCNKRERERRLHGKIRLSSFVKIAALPTVTALEDFSSYKPVFKLRKQIFGIVAPCGWVDAFRHFGEKYCPFYLGLWVRQLTHNPDYEDGTFLPYVGKKLPDHMAEKPRRPGSTTSTRWEPQITVFILFRTYLFWLFCILLLLCLFSCMIDFLWKNKTIKFFIIFGRQSRFTYNWTLKLKRKWEYCSASNIVTANSKDVVVFTAILVLRYKCRTTR